MSTVPASYRTSSRCERLLHPSPCTRRRQPIRDARDASAAARPATAVVSAPLARRQTLRVKRAPAWRRSSHFRRRRDLLSTWLNHTSTWGRRSAGTAGADRRAQGTLLAGAACTTAAAPAFPRPGAGRDVAGAVSAAGRPRLAARTGGGVGLGDSKALADPSYSRLHTKGLHPASCPTKPDYAASSPVCPQTQAFLTRPAGPVTPQLNADLYSRCLPAIAATYLWRAPPVEPPGRVVGRGAAMAYGVVLAVLALSLIARAGFWLAVSVAGRPCDRHEREDGGLLALVWDTALAPWLATPLVAFCCLGLRRAQVPGLRAAS